MRRKKPDPSTYDLTHPCPLCGYKIPPGEILHIDGEHILCPKCGKGIYCLIGILTLKKSGYSQERRHSNLEGRALQQVVTNYGTIISPHE
jgi:hypothetical protein